MRLAILATALAACSAPSAPQGATPTTIDIRREPPRRERIEVPQITVRVRAPQRPTVIYLASPPAYDGPALTAKLLTTAHDAAARRHARARLAAIAQLRDGARKDRVAVARAARSKASGALRELLDKHAAALTLEGRVLRAEVHLEHAEEQLDKKLVEQEQAGAVTDDIAIDVSAARAIIDAVFEDPELADAAQRSLDARYARARIYYLDDEATGAQLLLQVARDFPTSPLAQGSYHAAGHALFGVETPLARETAAEAFRWLAAHASVPDIRAMAQFRLGQLHDRAAAWSDGIAAFCKVLDDPKVDVAIADDTRTYLTRALARGGPAPLDAACAAQPPACPCSEAIVGDAAAHFRRVEDDASLALVVDRARTAFPTSAQVPTWSCDLVRIAERAGDERAVRAERARHESEQAATKATREPCKPPPVVDDRPEADIARARLASSGALTWCLERASEDHRLVAPAKLVLELAIDEHGKPDRVVLDAVDLETAECVRAWGLRQRWPDLARTLLVAPLALEP